MTYCDAVPEPAAIALVTHLNALRHTPLSSEVAAAQIVGDDVAHHVVDADGLLGLDPLAANDLLDALRAVERTTTGSWLLALPRPGVLGGLRGPAALNVAALAAGAVVLPEQGGPAFLPHRVGPAVQWRVLAADRPFPSPGVAETERALSGELIEAAAVLGELGAVSGTRPGAPTVPRVPPGYPPRQQRAVERALRLVTIAEAGLDDDREVLTSFAVQRRAEVLRRLHTVATDALCAACAWPADGGRA